MVERDAAKYIIVYLNKRHEYEWTMMMLGHAEEYKVFECNSGWDFAYAKIEYVRFTKGVAKYNSFPTVSSPMLYSE